MYSAYHQSKSSYLAAMWLANSKLMRKTKNCSYTELRWLKDIKVSQVQQPFRKVSNQVSS